MTFDEEAALKRSRKCQHEEVYEAKTPPINEETTCLLEDEAPEEHDMEKPQKPPMMEISRKRNPTWTREILREEERYGAPEGSTRERNKPNTFSNYLALMCDIVDQEHTNYEEAIQKKEWVEAMTEQY